MSKHRIIGVADDSTATGFMHPSDFSNDRYDGIGLYKRRNGKPVVLFRSKSKKPRHWQILDGSMDFHFLSYDDAVAFCRKRGYKLVEGK